MASAPEPSSPSKQPVIEPTRVYDARTGSWVDDLDLFRDSTSSSAAEPPPIGAEDDTQSLDLSEAPSAEPPEPEPPKRRDRGLLIAAVVLAASVVGFVLIFLLLTSRDIVPPPTDQGTSPPAVASQAPQPQPQDPALPERSDPGGSRVLRGGDSGPAVTDLQIRLLRVPGLYADGKVNGRYDDELSEVVARYQVWYGVQGDEEGVYGANTRRSLESQTPGAD